jgi:hypothetical protein
MPTGELPIQTLARTAYSTAAWPTDKHTIGSLPLAGVAGHGIAMIKMRMLLWIMADATTAAIHLHLNTPIVGDAL